MGVARERKRKVGGRKRERKERVERDRQVSHSF